MNASTAQLVRRRIVALVLIALVAVALVLLQLAGGSDAVSVPPGAHEGQLTPESCTYEEEPAECGALVAPELLPGAWLGSHVPEAPALGQLTAIVGAILGANVALIVLDVFAPALARAGEPEAPQAETLPGPA